MNEALRKSLVKEFGAHILVTPEEYEKEGYPTGSRNFDAILGEQLGLPGGRIVEIYGREQSGKTTLALHTIAKAQYKGKTCGLVDLEKFDPKYATRIGVDVKKLIIARPKASSEVLEVALHMLKNGCDLVVVDSVAALSSKKEMSKGIGEDTVAIVARELGKMTRQSLDPLFEAGNLLVFINQIRDKLSTTGMSGTTTPGGNALRGFASVRIEARRMLPIYQFTEKVKDELLDETTTTVVKRKSNDNKLINKPQIGQGTLLTVKKNKVSPPFRKVEIDIIFGQGIDQDSDTYDLAIQYKVLEQLSGGVVKYINRETGEVLCQAKNKYDMIDLLITKDLWSKVEEEVDIAWNQRGIFQLSFETDTPSPEDLSEPSLESPTTPAPSV